MTFQIHALPDSLFRDLFTLSDEELAARSACRVTADSKPGFPCRVSLADAEVGERLILLNYTHQPNDSPYRACHAVFVREGASEAVLQPGEIPDSIRSRLLSLRAFDSKHNIVAADVVEGAQLEDALQDTFEDPSVAYIHLHYAKPGCFAANVTRA